MNYLVQINLVLIMSVNPGFGGQKFMPEVLIKVKTLKKIQEEKGLNFDIACTGISKDEIEIQLNGDILKVNYDRSEEEDKEYIYKGIAKRSFDLGWKINSRFDVSKSLAEFDDGLLTITVPYAKGQETKTLKIK